MTLLRANGGNQPPRQTCEQCGRVGVRGFRTIPPSENWRAITVCANAAACRKRWPKVPKDDD